MGVDIHKIKSLVEFCDHIKEWDLDINTKEEKIHFNFKFIIDQADMYSEKIQKLIDKIKYSIPQNMTLNIKLQYINLVGYRHITQNGQQGIPLDHNGESHGN